jgi:hypothetical protein
MAEESGKGIGKLDQIIDSLDLLFERITDVGVQQQTMKTQIERNTQTMQQDTAEQQVMAKQIAEAGRAIARLTINQMRDAEDTESEVESQSVVSDVLKYFQREQKGKAQLVRISPSTTNFQNIRCPKFSVPSSQERIPPSGRTNVSIISYWLIWSQSIGFVWQQYTLMDQLPSGCKCIEGRTSILSGYNLSQQWKTSLVRMITGKP